jgi:hypothetical protein
VTSALTPFGWLRARGAGVILFPSSPERQTPSMRQNEKLWVEPTDRYEGHQFPESSDEFRVADGRPLWYALLDDPNVLVMDANRARGKLRELFRIEASTVRQCIGCPLEEVRKTFEPITSRE